MQQFYISGQDGTLDRSFYKILDGKSYKTFKKNVNK